MHNHVRGVACRTWVGKTVHDMMQMRYNSTQLRPRDFGTI